MTRRPTLAAMTEYHYARLTAFDNWDAVAEAVYAPGDTVSTVSQLLGVSDLGAYAAIAMARGPKPERAQLEGQLQMLSQIRSLLD